MTQNEIARNHPERTSDSGIRRHYSQTVRSNNRVDTKPLNQQTESIYTPRETHRGFITFSLRSSSAIKACLLRQLDRTVVDADSVS